MAKLETADRSQAVAIPENAHWPAEFSGWRATQQSTKRSLTGGTITQARALTAGRPIELVGFWLARDQVEILQAWADQPLAEYVLTLPDGREFAVIFSDENPLKASPVFEASAPGNATQYQVNRLAFLTI